MTTYHDPFTLEEAMREIRHLRKAVLQIDELRAALAERDAELAQISGLISKQEDFERVIAERDAEIERLTAERDVLRGALKHYANHDNWAQDFHGNYRKWLEPDSATPRAYNGFELAQAALKGKS